MSLLKSILFGCEGDYHIFGFPVKFQKGAKNTLPLNFRMPKLEGAALISQLASICMNSHTFRLITQGYTHVVAHEMSHALACKLLTGKNSQIYIDTTSCVGITEMNNRSTLAKWQDTVINLAGPMGDIAFSQCIFIALKEFKNHFSWPIYLVLRGGAVSWISGEILYAYSSALKRDNGDFGNIATNGKNHLLFACAAIVCQLALGVLLANKLKNRSSKNL